MTVNSFAQIENLRRLVIKHAEVSYVTVRESISSMTPVQFFAAMKFEKTGNDPIDGQPLNLIEQINQMYSALVVLAAAEDLLTLYPETTLRLQLGNGSGYDIESIDGSIAAECFSVTTVSSNRKLDKDCKKLMKSCAPVKYVYFYAHQDSDKKLQNQFQKYPDIRFKRIPLDIY